MVENGQKWAKWSKMIEIRLFFGRTYLVYHIYCGLLCNVPESNPRVQSISKVLDLIAPCKTASSSFEWTMSNEGDFVVQGGSWNHFFPPGLWLSRLDFYSHDSYRRVGEERYLIWKLFRRPILGPSQMYLGLLPSIWDLPRLFHWSSPHLIQGFKTILLKLWHRCWWRILGTKKRLNLADTLVQGPSGKKGSYWSVDS